MKQTSTRFAGFLFVAVLAVAVSFGQGTTITLLHMNDTHSHLDAYGPKDHHLNGTLGGIAKAATVIGTAKATEENVLVLHAGDAMVGDFFFNMYYDVPEFMFLKDIGVDAMAVGNHEFEAGPTALAGILGSAFTPGDLKMLGANVDIPSTSALKPFVTSSIIKTFDGVDVGVFALTIPGNPMATLEDVTILESIDEIAYQQVLELRSKGAEVVILLSHLGIYIDRMIAGAGLGIDVIVGGHDHLTFEKPEVVGSTLICQAGANYENIGKMKLLVKKNGTVKMTDYEMIRLDSRIPAEPSVQAMVDGLKLGIVANYGNVYTEVIARATCDVEETYDPKSPMRDTPLGNLLTDSYRWKTNTDLGITTLGIISQKIYAGPIVGADVFHAVSYGLDETTKLGLTLATGKITGYELLKAIEITLSFVDQTDDYFIQASGLAFKYDPTLPIGSRVLIPTVRINGTMIDPEATYSVTTDYGIVGVLDVMGVVMTDVELLPAFQYVVLRDYLASLHIVKPRIEGRIVDASIRSIAEHRNGKGEIGWKINKHGCHPNPFNPSTTITFELPAAADVSLKVFNMLGQEVAMLAQGQLAAGTHQRTFDATRLTSGVYFYRLESGSQVLTDKLILLK